MEHLHTRLDAGEVVLLDGGTGTELEQRGARMDGVNWSGASVVMHPDLVRQVHEDYIRAGAEIIITNSFATSRHVLECAGVGHMFVDVNKQAATLASQARANCREQEMERSLYVAGSISTFNAGLDRQSKPPRSLALANYRDQAEILMEAGADFIILEMVREIEPATHAVEGILAAGAPFWLGFSCQGARDGDPLLWDNKEETPSPGRGRHQPHGRLSHDHHAHPHRGDGPGSGRAHRPLVRPRGGIRPLRGIRLAPLAVRRHDFAPGLRGPRPGLGEQGGPGGRRLLRHRPGTHPGAARTTARRHPKEGVTPKKRCSP